MKHILVSNDDGVHALGIHTLSSELSKSSRVTVVAPLEERSTTGHSLTLDKPLRLQKISPNIWGCSGFPSDCTVMGLAEVCKESRPDAVVSGINHGANLGQDLYYSGTVAAAREAAFHGVPAMACSLVFKRAGSVDHYFETAAHFARLIVEAGVLDLLPKFSLINLNVPDLALKDIRGVKLTHVGFRHYSEEVHSRTDAREREYYWIAGAYKGYREDPHSDCHAVEEGFVSVTPQALISSQEYDFMPIRKAVEELNAQHLA
jgi:5'-nucleotidase